MLRDLPPLSPSHIDHFIVNFSSVKSDLTLKRAKVESTVKLGAQT